MTTSNRIMNFKIKEEKLDPEIEQKINCISQVVKKEGTIQNGYSAAGSSNRVEPIIVSNLGEENEKKSVEPVKSSNEILTELFQVFNAVPPKELLNDSNLINKVRHTKKHKKEKKKKHKKEFSERTENNDDSPADSQDSGKDIESKAKKRKKKGKHKVKEKCKEKEKDKQRSSANLKSNSNKSANSIEVKQEPHDTDHAFKVKSELAKEEDVSEISLSDEETYLKERERDAYNRPSDRSCNDFYNRGRDREYRRRDHPHEYKRPFYRKSRSRSRSRSRDRSRSRSRGLKIDKKRLLEIARKNAISMFKRGNLPGSAGMSEEVRDKVLLKMRYGGRTVEDLTEFCKKISNGEQFSDLSSDEESDVDKNGNAKAFHHPFQLKEREPIVMHIKKPTVSTRPAADQTKAITMQFPVSSGQQHRMTENWVPVQPKEQASQTLAAPPQVNMFKSKAVTKNVFDKPIPQHEQQEPAFKPLADLTQPPPPLPLPLPLPSVTPAVEAMSTPVKIIGSAMPMQTAHPEPVPPAPPAVQSFIPDVPIPETVAPVAVHNIFAQPAVDAAPMDVSSIISKRLNAMRRLQANPMDSEAIKLMHNSQQEMSTWAGSKPLPGQFTGSTGVNVLKVHELNTGPQLWARRDQLRCTRPVTGGMGMHLLQKMGWKPGEGLGREKTGSLQPLLLDIKLDKRGLVSKEDIEHRRPQHSKKAKSNCIPQTKQNMHEKHPVCLLNELTSKRKWTPPLYSLVNESGPSHNKMFLFSVSINGQTFTPSQASNTKKEAKLLAARHCLQQIGILH